MEVSMLDPAPAGQSVDALPRRGYDPLRGCQRGLVGGARLRPPCLYQGEASKIADLLDLKRFPGKRALPDGPRYTLELALLADGVEPENVYHELGTTEGADRAFAALDKIKPEILWWDKAKEPISWLIESKAAMAAGYSGRIFRAAIAARQRLDVLWEGQIYDLDLWAIPKAAKNKDEAKRFIAFATAPARWRRKPS